MKRPYEDLSSEEIIERIQAIVRGSNLNLELFSDGHAKGQKEKLIQAVKASADKPEKADEKVPADKPDEAAANAPTDKTASNPSPQPDQATRVIETNSSAYMRGFLMRNLPQIWDLAEELLIHQHGRFIFQQALKFETRVGNKLGLTAEDMKQELLVRVIGSLMPYDRMLGKANTYLGQLIRATQNEMQKELVRRTHRTHQDAAGDSFEDGEAGPGRSAAMHEDHRELDPSTDAAHLEIIARVQQFVKDELDDREKRIYYARSNLDDDKTLKQLGAELGVTKERIRQIESRIIGRLVKVLVDAGIDAALIESVLSKKKKPKAEKKERWDDASVLAYMEVPSDPVFEELYLALQKATASGNTPPPKSPAQSLPVSKFVIAGLVAGKSNFEIASLANAVTENNNAANTYDGRFVKHRKEWAQAKFLKTHPDLVRRVSENPDTPARVLELFRQLSFLERGEDIPKPEKKWAQKVRSDGPHQRGKQTDATGAAEGNGSPHLPADTAGDEAGNQGFADQARRRKAGGRRGGGQRPPP